MRNPFKKKTPDDPPNRVVQLADTLAREGCLEALEERLEKMDKATLTEAELESWWHFYGIEAFRNHREALATSRFEEGHKRVPASALLRFSLGQQYVRSRRLDEGFTLLSASLFPSIPQEYALAAARYAYLWDRCDEGRAMLRPFLDAYKNLKILDDTFLYMRGMPFFGQWWSYLAAVCLLSEDTRELEEATEWAAREGSEFDVDYLRAELAAYRDGKPDALVGWMQESLEALPPGIPSGFTRMRLAVEQARAAASHESAEALVLAVTLEDNDRLWLNDIRTLALAEIAFRFNRPDQERKHVDAFLVRQPMLFEPDNALSFHLLEYQERLKPRYRDRRGS